MDWWHEVLTGVGVAVYVLCLAVLAWPFLWMLFYGCRRLAKWWRER